MWLLIPKAGTSSSPAHNGSLWVRAEEKHHLEGAGDGEVFYFPCLLQECSLVSVSARLTEPPPIQPFIWHTKATSQEDKLSLCHSSSPLLSMPPSLSLSRTLVHTRTPRPPLAYEWTCRRTWMWTSGKLVVKKKKQAATPREKAWECQLTSMWHSPGWHRLKRSLICLDQTCSETQLDPKALIPQTDEYRGSHAKENGVDKPFFLLWRRFFQAWLHWVNHSLIVVRL